MVMRACVRVMRSYHRTTGDIKLFSGSFFFFFFIAHLSLYQIFLSVNFMMMSRSEQRPD